MDFQNHKTVLIVCGPTAVGKTSVAIQLAGHFNTEIISADSRQCYRELNIGVARPSTEELHKVTHHFIASHSIHEEVTAATFEQYALEKVNKIFEKRHVVVMAGGTGLYIKAFCDGLDIIPAIEPSVRKKIIRQYEMKGLEWLQQELKKKDAAYFSQGEIKNPQRMMRALEVIEATGKSILSFQSGKKKKRNFHICKIGLQLPKEELLQNITARIDHMISSGLLDEVKSLTSYKHLNALQTVGYTEIFDYLDGKISWQQAINRIITNTRRFAKRQMTWFRKDPGIRWFSPLQIEEIILYAKSQLEKVKNQ